MNKEERIKYANDELPAMGVGSIIVIEGERLNS